ncbi:MAG: hypothetical protein CMO55_06535 [Verrucomicrobiales bacterium]|nr:hypothetical protein [Verrucomicrobiales bacterium]
MNETFQFAYPVTLWIGLAVCIALVFGMVSWNRRRERDLEKLAHTRLLEELTASVSRRRRRIRQALWILGVFCVFAALARPQYGFEYREVKRRGIDIVFAVDTSRSMLAEDVAPNRLERARLAITDFVNLLEGDRVALIPFAGNAFSLCPLTLDYGAFQQSLDALDTDIIPHQGTDLATAVEEANRLFNEEGNNYRILVLVTDGEDLQGAVKTALDTAKEKGMVIYTVGVGDPKGALIPITQTDGSQDFVRDQSGEPVRTALDEETLKLIADQTGGIYAPLGRAGEGLNQIYREKLRLAPESEFDQRLDRIPLERFEWPLALGILLLSIEFLLGDRRRRARKKKTPVVSDARRDFHAAPAESVKVALLVLSLIVTATMGISQDDTVEILPSDPREIYNLGTEAYNAGEFERAAEVLGDGLEATTDLGLQQKGYYNLGNARYRIGQQSQQENPEATIKSWESSVKAFEDALALDPEDEDAAFNRDFVKKKLDELKQQQDQQEQEQEQEQSDDSKTSEQSDEKQKEDQQSDSSEQESEEQNDAQSQSSKEESAEENQKEQQSSGGESEEDQDKEQQASQQGGEKEEQGETDPDETSPQPEQKEAEQKQGESTLPQKGEPSEEQPQETNATPGDASFSEERRNPGEMSKEEAAQLLEALKSDERSVLPLPDQGQYRRSVPDNTTNGKTW